MKAFLILEDGHVFTGTSIGSAKGKSSVKLSLTLP